MKIAMIGVGSFIDAKRLTRLVSKHKTPYTLDKCLSSILKFEFVSPRTNNIIFKS
jgi:hypothetical protein